MRLALIKPRNREGRGGIPEKTVCVILGFLVEVPMDSQQEAFDGWWLFELELVGEKGAKDKGKYLEALSLRW